MCEHTNMSVLRSFYILRVPSASTGITFSPSPRIASREHLRWRQHFAHDHLQASQHAKSPWLLPLWQRGAELRTTEQPWLRAQSPPGSTWVSAFKSRPQSLQPSHIAPCTLHGLVAGPVSLCPGSSSRRPRDTVSPARFPEEAELLLEVFKT